MEDDVEGGLEIVLRLAEECGVDPVGFAANRKTGVQPVVEADAGLGSESTSAAARRLGLQVCAADQSMGPRLEPVAAATDADSTTAAEIFYVFILEDRGGEASDDVALDCEPAVGEVADRGIGADEAGVDDAGLEAVKADADSQLPAVIIAISVNKIGFGSRRSGSRLGSAR